MINVLGHSVLPPGILTSRSRLPLPLTVTDEQISAYQDKSLKIANKKLNRCQMIVDWF